MRKEGKNPSRAEGRRRRENGSHGGHARAAVEGGAEAHEAEGRQVRMGHKFIRRKYIHMNLQMNLISRASVRAFESFGRPAPACEVHKKERDSLTSRPRHAQPRTRATHGTQPEFRRAASSARTRRAGDQPRMAETQTRSASE